ncbi:MAG: hypothetical protein ACRC7I_12025 [Selenomonadaceae bacterium]
MRLDGFGIMVDDAGEIRCAGGDAADKRIMGRMHLLFCGSRGYFN